MAWGTLFKYLGLAMDAATAAAAVLAEVQKAKAPGSPGGSEITDQEKKDLVANLDQPFADVITRICSEAGLPVKSVKLEIELD